MREQQRVEQDKGGGKRNIAREGARDRCVMNSDFVLLNCVADRVT